MARRAIGVNDAPRRRCLTTAVAARRKMIIMISILGDLVIVSLRFFLNLKQTGHLG
jgi:hypothetical protein